MREKMVKEVTSTADKDVSVVVLAPPTLAA